MFAGASGGNAAPPVLLWVVGDCAKAAAGSSAVDTSVRANARKQFKA
jgi:hypothetical protein